jgi:hypothetical protein
MKRSTIANVLTIAAFTALSLSIAPKANAYDGGCSNATSKGTFAEQDNAVCVGVMGRFRDESRTRSAARLHRQHTGGHLHAHSQRSFHA